MRRGGFSRFFKLAVWQMSLLNAWSTSVAMFFVYLYTYDRFRLATDMLLQVETPEAGAWRLLLSSASSRFEPVLVALHSITLVALLFAFEESEGLSYVKHVAGAGRVTVYAAKFTAYSLLSFIPLFLAKLTIVASWDYRAFALPCSLSFISKLALNALLVVGYLFPIYAAATLLVKRPAYFAMLAFLELYLFEDPAVGPLKLRQIHLDALTALKHPAEILSSHPEVFAASLLAALLHLMWLSFKGEVKWR